jgi:AcrR family transcriptional regulator
MLRAAQQVFSERGYTGARMIDIAEVAGVAVQTLYFTFHTKPVLLQACYELAVLGEDDPAPPPQQPWYAAALTSRTGPAALSHFAGGAAAIIARVAVLDDVVRSAGHEPEAAQVRDHNERLRRDGYRRFVEHLRTRYRLHAGLDTETATDLLLTLAGPATYRPLVIEYRWPHDTYVTWLTTTLTNQLLAPKNKSRTTQPSERKSAASPGPRPARRARRPLGPRELD